MNQRKCYNCGATIEHLYNHKCPYCRSFIDFNISKTEDINPRYMYDVEVRNIEYEPYSNRIVMYFKGKYLKASESLEYVNNNTLMRIDYESMQPKDVYYPECVLPNKKAFILLDYITNLQQENDDLKNNLENEVADNNLRLEENSKLEIALQNIQEDYDRRIEEINYLNEELGEEKRIEEADLKTIQRLEEENESHINRIHELEQEIDCEYISKENYKSRCEKASDKLSFIDEALENDTLNVPLCIVKINSALNILQNGSDDNEF